MSRASRLSVAGLTAAVVAVAGCMVPVISPADGDTRPAPAPGTAGAWKPCPEVAHELYGRGASGVTYECATVPVPRDWNNKDGKTYDISLLRARSNKQKNRIGSLLINPGGPGGSGVETAVALSFGRALGGLPDDILARFDLVGFDPRGVGRSSPVKCIPDADTDAMFGLDPDPVTQPEFDRVAATYKKIADECAATYPGQLPLFSTEQAAKDIDAVREAVGDQKTTFLGWSYGTLLGATYAQLFPTRVRAMVLDGAIDPQQNYLASVETQGMGFERAYGNFATWCGQTPDKCPIAPDAKQALLDLLGKAEASPVKTTAGREATSGWVFLSVIASLYTQDSWPELAKSLKLLQDGNATGIFRLADRYAQRDPSGKYTNLFDANFAVNCADTDAAVKPEEARRLQGEWRQKYPIFGPSMATGLLSCTWWPQPRDPYPAGAAKGAPAIVVVGTTGDPATPYENTARLASMLGVGHVMTWEGEGHTAYPETPCVVNAVDAYLIDLVVPREGLRCPAK